MANRFSKYEGSPSQATVSTNRFSKYTEPPKTGDSFGTIEPKAVTWGDKLYYGLKSVGLPASKMREELQGLDDTVRGTANGLTLGLADMVAGALGDGIDAEARKTELAKERSPYGYLGGKIAGSMLPASKISQGLGAMGLGVNTIGKAVANGAMTNLGMYTGEEAVDGNVPDATGMAMSGVLGAAGGAFSHYLSGLISPATRIAHAAGQVDDATKGIMAETMSKATDSGVPLTVPEVVSSVFPTKGSSLQALLNRSSATPKGSQAATAFDEARRISMGKVGKDVVGQIGQGVDPFVASKSAENAISSAKELVRNSAKPYYESVAGVKVPSPPSSEAVKQALKQVSGDKIKMEALRDAVPSGKVSRDSIHFLDAVKKQMDTNFRMADEKMGDPLLSSAIADKSRQLVGAMDEAAPNYAVGRGISEQGGAMARSLEKGPLGAIASTPNVRTQSNSIFGANNEVERGLSENALRRMDPEVGRGLLANHLDSAISSNPLTFASKALPTEQAMSLARTAAGPAFDPIEGAIRSARMISGDTHAPVSAPMSGPVNDFWYAMKNHGSDKVVKMMHDPRTIDRLGETTMMEQILNSGSSAVTTNAIKARTDKRRKR